MGREIRRVPPDWEHPKHERCPHGTVCRPVCYRPLYDEDYDSAAEKWMGEFDKWRAGDRDSYCTEKFFWDWDGGPPSKDSYRERAWSEAEATHYQVYETVSEGTPVTPHFATKAELVDYLVKHGDFWDQQRGAGGWSRDAAEGFVGSGWAPSLMVNTSAAGVSIREPRDGMPT